MWFRKYIWLKLLTKTIKGNYENVTEEEEEEEEEEKDCVTPFIYFICLLGYKTVKWDLGKNSWSKGNATFVNLVVNLFKEVKKKKEKLRMIRLYWEVNFSRHGIFTVVKFVF